MAETLNRIDEPSTGSGFAITISVNQQPLDIPGPWQPRFFHLFCCQKVDRLADLLT